LPVINTNTQGIQYCSRFQSPPNYNKSQNSQSPPLSTILISHSTQILNFRHSMYYTSICPLCINSTKNNSSQTNCQRNSILCKNSTQRQEFSNKVRGLGLSHITKTKDEEPNTKERHSCCSSTQVFQSFCVCSIILSSNTLKLCWTPYSVSLHCENRTKNTYFVHCKQR
jgi:hypothetical protein